MYLVRLCDGGHLLPRARVVLDLTGVFPDAARVPALSELLTRTVTIDLFTPPQRERIRAEVVRRVAASDGQRAIAAGFAEYVTQAAVHNAWALDQRMKELGLHSPYVLVTDPPSDYPKLHRPWRCRFEPAVGYTRPPVE